MWFKYLHDMQDYLLTIVLNVRSCDGHSQCNDQSDEETRMCSKLLSFLLILFDSTNATPNETNQRCNCNFQECVARSRMDITVLTKTICA